MGYVAVKMNQAQEVQTHGWGQSTQHPATQDPLSTQQCPLFLSSCLDRGLHN